MVRQFDAAGNMVEYLRQPLYDSIEITTTGTEWNFFATPRGQGGKTYFHTNLPTAGTLPVPKSHLVDGFRFVPTSYKADAKQVPDMRQLMWNQTWFAFIVGSLKSYLTIPLWYLPAGVGIPGFADQAGSTTASAIVQVSNGAPVHQNYFGIRSHPILIPSQQTFSATVNADAALATMTESMRCWVFLEGVHGRETL